MWPMDWAGGWGWLDRYELDDLASELLSFRSPTVCWTPPSRHHGLVCFTFRARMGDADMGDRTYLVLAKPNVIMNECAVKCTLIEWR